MGIGLAKCFAEVFRADRDVGKRTFGGPAVRESGGSSFSPKYVECRRESQETVSGPAATPLHEALEGELRLDLEGLPGEQSRWPERWAGGMRTGGDTLLGKQYCRGGVTEPLRILFCKTSFDVSDGAPFSKFKEYFSSFKKQISKALGKDFFKRGFSNLPAFLLLSHQNNQNS